MTAGRKYWGGLIPSDRHEMVGLGPASMRIDDEIWILAGGTHPVALRPYWRDALNGRLTLHAGEPSHWLSNSMSFEGSHLVHTPP